MAALFSLIMLIIASFGCIFLYMKLDSCQSKLVTLVQFEGECTAFKMNKIETTEVAKTKDYLQDELKNVHKDTATKEDERVKDWKKRADKLEEERDRLRIELSKLKDEKVKKDIDYLKCSKNLDDCQNKKSESSSSS